jgi:L-arabinonolactonase
MERIGTFTLTWGESLRWDDRRQRLYFVDCATQRLHWLDGAAPPLGTMPLPGLPTGVVLTEDSRLVICLDDGLHVVDPDAETVELLTPYPDGLHGRANDANADGAGNLVTGTLNLGPGAGAVFWFSAVDGWRQLDGEFGNANGPVGTDFDGEPSLVFGDTVAAAVYRYPYDGAGGAVGTRTVLSSHSTLDGAPDGATADEEGAVWSCVLRSGKLARLTGSGVDRVVEVPMANPSSLAFAGPDLDRLFVTSIALELGGETKAPAHESAWLMALDVGVRGRPEARFRLP